MRDSVVYHVYKRTRAILATKIYGNPSKDLFVIGVTGTDGKSTTANMIHKIINDNISKAALLSTINIKFWDQELPNQTKMTSFDPFLLQHYLSLAKSEDIKYVVVEVSSHALHQHRFDWVEFDMGVLTNITPEHLDYHKNFEDYVQTKKKLFLSILNGTKPVKYAVFPKDDEIGIKWFEELPFDRSLSYGIIRKWNVFAQDIVESLDDTKFKLGYLSQIVNVKMSLLGKFNVYNALAAASVGLLLGVDIEKIKTSLEGMSPLPGRMEVFVHKAKTWVVDFAHTPNGLKNVLSFLRQTNKAQSGKLIAVFWAPWERDPYKRPQMAKIVEQFADKIILTSDDPAGESRYKIIKDVSEWFAEVDPLKIYLIPHRKAAIQLADFISEPGDIILVAGKWHETQRWENRGKESRSDKNMIYSLK